MATALGEPTTILLFGGTSDIGVAVVRAVSGASTTTVVLACRDVERGGRVADGLRSSTMDVHVVGFEATDRTAPARVVQDAAARFGDLDLVVVAHAVLGDGAVTTRDPIAAAELIEVNVGSAVGCVVAAGEQLRRQGRGDIVVLSSVAGERVRSANPVYGGSKAGVDGFAQGYGDLVAPDGVHVMVVRPGFVHSAMTAGLAAAPLATTPEAVAAVVARGLRARRRMVWAPPLLRIVFAVFRHLPGTVWRRLPLG